MGGNAVVPKSFAEPVVDKLLLVVL